MQKKHLIAFTLVTIFMLLGFNIINDNRHEKDREAMMNDSAIDNKELPIADGSDTQTQSASSSDIASKPLGEQPKAIIDNATNKIDQAQQADADRLAKMDEAQQ